MEKLKLFEFTDSQHGFNSLIECLKNCCFDESAYNARGFVINEIYNEEVFCTFLEKIDITQEIIYPSGVKVEQNISSLREVDFHIAINSKINLIVRNPPRSLTSFFSALTLATNFNLIIAPVEIDLSKFIDLALGSLKEFIIKGAECSNIVPRENVMAKIALKSESTLVNYLDEISQKSGQIDLISFGYKSDGKLFSADLSKTGMLKHNGRNHDDCKNILALIEVSRLGNG